MKHAFETENATVINRENRGESSIYITAFCAASDIIQLMKRVSAKNTSQLPDLFDDIDVKAESQTPNGLKFLRDFEIIKRRINIGKSYESFSHASLIASVVSANGRNIEDAARLSFRLRHALDALDNGVPPEPVRLKFMFLMARDEGYPIKEDFFENLSAAKREMFATLIRTPSADLREFRSRAADMLESMCAWIYSNTDIAEG